MKKMLIFAALVAALFAPVRSAHAFCGFYVSGADGSMYANATMVVMMRSGTRTVLSMQNNYQGPPEDFAMVVPVPTVLGENDVKTLPHEIFEHVDQLAAPRLVEYWEQDPCYEEVMPEGGEEEMVAMTSSMDSGGDAAGELGVTIHAQFAVAEYDVVILGARDSAGLDTWLRRESYNIPDGTDRVLRTYVEQGTKFFVAKVDVQRVEFRDGQAVLSPLRFHYDTDTFSLPVRLGLLNSRGEQDLIVHILAPNTRYEVANYPNAIIPTNLVVADRVREAYGQFYESLFRETLARHPGAVVTEYAWAAGSCDPCPTPGLDPSEIDLLGNDVIGADAWSMVLTRLHYRYGRDGLDEDLVFRAGDPLVGGTGMPDANGRIDQTVRRDAGGHTFQGRYVILHPWEGDMDCSSPQRGSWGGPPAGGQPTTIAASNQALSTGAPPQPIGNLAGFIAGPVEGLDLTGSAPPPQLPASGGGCASCAVSAPGAASTAGLLGGAFVLLLVRRRRRR